MKNNKLYLPLFALSILIIITLACGSSTPTSEPKVSTATAVEESQQSPSDTNASAEIDKTSLPTDIPTPESTEMPVQELYLGDAVSEFGYALTGVSVIDPATPGMLYTAAEGTKLIAVEVIISNLSGDNISINPLNSTLLDQDGFTYQVELGGVDDQLATLDLSPGEKVSGFLAYEVPENAVASKIKYALEAFGSTSLKASLSPAPAGHVPVAEPPSTESEPLPKLGDVVENFGYSLSATTVEDPAKPGMLYTPKEGYKLVAVEIILGNVSGSEPLGVNPMNAYLIDNKGFVYTVELGGRDDQIDTIDLATGEKVKGWVAFTIPEGAIPTSVKYSVEYFSDNFLQTGLTK